MARILYRDRQPDAGENPPEHRNRDITITTGTTRGELFEAITNHTLELDRNDRASFTRYEEWWKVVQDLRKKGSIRESDIEQAINHWLQSIEKRERGEGCKGRLKAFLQDCSADGKQWPHEERPRTGLFERRAS